MMYFHFNFKTVRTFSKLSNYVLENSKVSVQVAKDNLNVMTLNTNTRVFFFYYIFLCSLSHDLEFSCYLIFYYERNIHDNFLISCLYLKLLNN